MRHATLLHLPANFCVYTTGDVAEHYYILLSGSVRLEMVSINRSSKRNGAMAREVQPGEGFGEILLMGERNHELVHEVNSFDIHLTSS